MKKVLVISVAVLAVVLGYAYVHRPQTTTKVLTGDQAIALVKKTYPAYQDYPSDTVPRKSVEATTTADGWRVGMYTGSANLPGILKADCFLVTHSGTVVETGFFSGEGPAKSINLSTCTPTE